MKGIEFSYPTTLIREKGTSGFTVRFRDLPEAITSGADRREALEQAADCLEEAIANRIVMRLEIPVPSAARPSQPLVPVPAPMAAKLALYLAMKEAGVSNTTLARRLGCDEKEVRRMLDPRHPTKLPRVQAALRLLGKRLIVGMEVQSPLQLRKHSLEEKDAFSRNGVASGRRRDVGGPVGA